MEQKKRIVHNLLEKIAEEQQYNDPNIIVKVISSDGANFTTFLFRGTISANGIKSLDLFIKVAAAGKAMRAQQPLNVFANEVFFYTELLGEYKKLETDHNIKGKHRLVVPKFYGFDPTRYEETLVLENLTSKGYTSYRTECLGWEYVSTALTELAKLHALGFAFVEDSEMFHKVTMKFEWKVTPEKLELIFGAAIKRALAVLEDQYQPHFVRFTKKFLTIENIMKYILPNTKVRMLRHGDFRASNLMHKYNEDGSLSIIPVDYQLVQLGNPLNDIFYLIFSSTDAKFRAKYWEKTFEHYYTQLCAALERFGLNPEEKYSKDDFNKSLKEIMPYGIVVALTALVLVTVEQPPKLGCLSPESFGRLKVGRLYQERLNGIVGDYIRWGYMD